MSYRLVKLISDSKFTLFSLPFKGFPLIFIHCPSAILPRTIAILRADTRLHRSRHIRHGLHSPQCCILHDKVLPFSDGCTEADIHNSGISPYRINPSPQTCTYWGRQCSLRVSRPPALPHCSKHRTWCRSYHRYPLLSAQSLRSRFL